MGRLVCRAGDNILDGLPVPVRNGDVNLMDGGAVSDGDGVPITGDGLAGEVGDRRLLLLGLGEDRIGLVYDLPVEAVAETGHAKVQPHKVRLLIDHRRPCDRFMPFQHSGVPVRI